MAANTSGFSRNQPSGDSSIRLGDDLIRSDKSIFEETLNSEHYFTPQTAASSLSGGVHRHGSGRMFSGTRASLVTPSSADSEGRLFYATEYSALLYVGTSSTSTIVGGSQPYGATVVSATGALASSATTAIVFSVEDYDVGGFFSANSSRLVLYSAGSGRYLITGSISFLDSGKTGARREAAIRFAGASGGTLAIASGSTHDGGAVNLSVSGMHYSATSNRYYELAVYQDTGVSLTTSEYTASFSIARL